MKQEMSGKKKKNSEEEDVLISESETVGLYTCSREKMNILNTPLKKGSK